MVRQWRAREYRDGDELGIIDLRKIVFGEVITKDLWEWQFKNNFGGEAVIILAESEQEIVGQYALVPRMMKVGQSTCLGSLSLDTMIHPDYRGQGMFTILAQRAYELADSKGIRFIYGFPNQNSYHTFLTRLSWVDICEGVPLWVKPLNFQRVISWFLKGNQLIANVLSKPAEMVMNIVANPKIRKPSCSVREVSYFDDRFDAFCSNALINYRIAQIRDRASLTWRYVDKPDKDYTILLAERGIDLLGYAVLKCIDKFGLQIGFIVDILTSPDETYVSDDLISTAVNHFKRRGGDIIGCLILSGVNYSRSLQRAGFVKAPNRFLPQKMYVGIRSFSSQFSNSFLADPNNWFMTFGDHDAL